MSEDVGRKVSPPVIPDIPPHFDKDLIRILEALRDSMDLREGRVAAGRNTRFVTIQDLVDAGVIAQGDIE